MNQYHTPVLLQQVYNFLQVRPGGIYVDCTVGMGGHTEKIAEGALPDGKVVAIDIDGESIARARQRLARFGSGIEFAVGNFAGLDTILSERGIESVDGIVIDLGMSSYQLSRPERGFAFSEEGPLDMRMNQSGRLTAAEVVNRYPEKEIARILWEFGEERFSKKIAVAIVRFRNEKKIESTTQLAEIVAGSIPRRYQSRKIQPATRTFQALRVFVNSELENLVKVLPDAVGCLKTGARLAVISFHSLEDRIVKTRFRNFAAGCICPPSFPVCRCDHIPLVRILTRKPIVCTDDEMRLNPRSRSAKLRVCEKIPTRQPSAGHRSKKWR